MRTIEDLGCKGLVILQDDDLYKFTNDAILLVNLSKVKKGSFVVDLCSGCGIIPILVAGKSRVSKVVGIEYQKSLYDLAVESVALNKQGDLITFINDDIKNASKYVRNNTVDVVLCNPPYFKLSIGKKCENESKKLAKMEVAITLKDVVCVASKLLKHSGHFYMVHQASRVQEIMSECLNNNLAIKELTFCKSNKKSKPHIIIIDAVKGGKCDCKINDDIVINESDGTYTEVVNKLYNKQSIEID